MSAGLQIGLVQACDDSQLFGVKLWPRQREILAAIERGENRLFVLCLGRRSSKTTMSALTMLWTCLLRPELREMVRSRERLWSVGVATNLRQARLLVSAARSIVEDSPLLAPMLESSTEDELRFSNGTALAAFPCSSRAGRGWPIACLVADEMAFMLSETEGPAVADRVWTSLVPASAQFGAEARLIAASTPNGTDGLFARLFRQAEDGELSDARAFHATSAEMNPTLDPGLLVLEERRDPDGFAAEYLAQFTGSGGAFLDMDRFTVSDRDYALSPAEILPPVVVGLDPAFAGSDEFGVAVVGRDPEDPSRLVLASVDGFKPQRVEAIEARAEVQLDLLARVAATIRRYGADAVTDQYASRQVVEFLRREGLSVRVLPMTATTKTSAYVELRARLYSGGLLVYREPALLDELRRLRSRVAAGQSSVVVPRTGGSHGDRGQALAIAVLHQAQLGAPATGTVSGGRSTLDEVFADDLGMVGGQARPLGRPGWRDPDAPRRRPSSVRDMNF